MAMDLANYLNETMIDNAYPLKNGVCIYLDNCMEEQELIKMAAVYLKRYFDKYATDLVKAAYNDDIETFLQ